METSYDLRTNLDNSSGYCQCHTSLDVLLTADGDLSIVSGTDELQQRFFLYLAIPKGERYDPNIGCYAYDYLHEKNTRNVMRSMEQDIKLDMKYQFPEISVSSVSCIQDEADQFRMALAIRLSDGNALNFLYTPEELQSLTAELSNISLSNY